jgi:hypothetical protein
MTNLETLSIYDDIKIFDNGEEVDIKIFDNSSEDEESRNETSASSSTDSDYDESMEQIHDELTQRNSSVRSD